METKTRPEISLPRFSTWWRIFRYYERRRYIESKPDPIKTNWRPRSDAIVQAMMVSFETWIERIEKFDYFFKHPSDIIYSFYEQGFSNIIITNDHTIRVDITNVPYHWFVRSLYSILAPSFKCRCDFIQSYDGLKSGSRQILKFTFLTTTHQSKFVEWVNPKTITFDSRFRDWIIDILCTLGVSKDIAKYICTFLEFVE
jgi:hypothetical protein